LAPQMQAKHEAEIQRLKFHFEQEGQKLKESENKASTELERLRAVCGALEKQSAASRAQAENLKASSAHWEKVQERYKAEFMVLQRKWTDREKEIRQEEAQAKRAFAEGKERAEKLLEVSREEIRALKTALSEANARLAQRPK